MTSEAPAILVVDDETDVCHNLADILTASGYDVDTAGDGASALELVRRRPYDLALLDLKMPGMDGLCLFREIRKIRSETPAMFVTAFAGGDTAQQAMNAGACRIVRKPVDVDRLLEFIRPIRSAKAAATQS